MVLLSHIVIALASVVYTAYMSFFPSKNKLKVSYLLVSLTIGTGFYLIFSGPAAMIKTCLVGLAYLGVVGFGIMATKNKLAKDESLP